MAIPFPFVQEKARCQSGPKSPRNERHEERSQISSLHTAYQARAIGGFLYFGARNGGRDVVLDVVVDAGMRRKTEYSVNDIVRANEILSGNMIVSQTKNLD
ncbi:hypothetical protein [Caballeronia choica]|uniref:hypothetical protein n=1 Tax=Caballeronia choica TaxID=326476 RepID=UPI000F738DC4|nr:hypothetical protein [Caballeronia choica]